MQKLPQTLVNVRVRRRDPLESFPEVQAAIREAEALLGSDGRLLVRYSGTEPLVRVMAEGMDMARIQASADFVVKSIRAALG
jgi:phosphoglucosamine mutase